MAEQAPVPDWKGMFPDINEKYSDLLQSHHSLCGEIEQKSGYIRELSDALEETRKERDDALLQIDDTKKQQKSDVYTMGEISKCRDEAFRQLDETKQALADKTITLMRIIGAFKLVKEMAKEICPKLRSDSHNYPIADCLHDPAVIRPCYACRSREALSKGGK